MKLDPFYPEGTPLGYQIAKISFECHANIKYVSVLFRWHVQGDIRIHSGAFTINSDTHFYMVDAWVKFAQDKMKMTTATFVF